MLARRIVEQENAAKPTYDFAWEKLLNDWVN
jgi:hypothetical protein